MARIFPGNPEPDAPTSERYVFSQLRDSLPDDWVVFHSRRIFIPASAKQSRWEGEMDFVVVDPARGLLGLEVKGGGIERKGNGWFSIDRNGVSHEIKDPARQASAATHRLAASLRSQLGGAPSFRLGFGWGVVFPDVDVRGDLGNDLPRNLVVARDDFSDLAQAINRIFEAQQIAGSPLGQGAMSKVIARLAPSCRMIATLSNQLEDEQEAFVRLTAEQGRILDSIEGVKRCAIEGTAGTGKTLLALEKAKRAAAEGKRVILLCFNRALAESLSKRADGFEAKSFHSLCREMADKANVPFSPPSKSHLARGFWENTAPEILLQALEQCPDERYDAVVVDEGQDFRENWWTAIDELLADPKQCIFYVFFDRLQNLWSGGLPEDLGTIPIKLTENCRNTHRIAEFAHRPIGQPAVLRSASPAGAEVEVHSCGDADDVANSLRKVVHRLTADGGLKPDQIVVLSAHSLKKSVLKKHRKFGNLSLVPNDKAAGPNDLRFASLHQFKGLESDVVILVDMQANPGEDSMDQIELYVASSRAKHLLIVIEGG